MSDSAPKLGATAPNKALIKRTGDGKFLKGNPPGPGRPAMDAGTREQVKEMFRAASPRAAQVLIEAMEDEDPDRRMRAAQAVLDRFAGKPAQVVISSEGGPVELNTQNVFVALEAVIEKAKKAGG